MAKKKKSTRENRVSLLGIRLTQEERDALDGLAAGQHLDTSTWARVQLLQLVKGKEAKKGGG